MSIKYRTSAGTSASNFTDLVVKVGDTLPIGAIIEYDTSGTIPSGWEIYTSGKIKKISPTTPANGNIENQYGTSQTNAYSEAYANTTFASKNIENYSTTETIVGTWTDGKPLYRKVDNTSVSLTANTWTNLRYKSGEKALVKCIISDCNDFTDANSCLTYPVIARLYGNYIQIYSFINTTVKCVIVEYTKTTD